MEEISFPCPSCGIQLKLPAEAAGITGPCPRCRAEITAPDAPPAPEPPAWPELELPGEEPLPEFFEDFHGFTDPMEMARHPSVVDPQPPREPVAPSPAEQAAYSEPLPPAPPSPVRRPEPPEVATSAPAGRRGGISIPVFVLSCLVGACFAFAGGFLVGVRTPLSVPPPIVVPPPDPPMKTSSAVPQPAPPSLGDGETAGAGSENPTVTLPLEGIPEGEPSPEATLNAFLTAPDWAARNVWVLNGEELAADMREDAATFGDGPIATTSVEPLRTVGGAHVYLVCTPELPRGFPVAVMPTLDEWLVDWISFRDFHRDSFKRFTEGPADTRGSFRLLVKPARVENTESLFEPYVLSPPMPDRQQVAWVPKGTLADARLKTIFESRAGYSEEDFSKLMKQAGPPLVVSVYKGENSQGDHFFQIEEIDGIGWIPELP